MIWTGSMKLSESEKAYLHMSIHHSIVVYDDGAAVKRVMLHGGLDSAGEAFERMCGAPVFIITSKNSLA
jgi:hypothetical protein